jgi:hypothetical protein
MPPQVVDKKATSRWMRQDAQPHIQEVHGFRDDVRSPSYGEFSSVEAMKLSELPEVNDLWVAGLCGASVAARRSHDGGFSGIPPLCACQAGDSLTQFQSLLCAETHVVFYAKCPHCCRIFNRNWKVAKNFTKTTQYQISWKSVQLF